MLAECGCWDGSSPPRDRGCGKWPRAWACIAWSTWPVVRHDEPGGNRKAVSQLELIQVVSRADRGVGTSEEQLRPCIKIDRRIERLHAERQIALKNGAVN